jgi:hypothetical protein
MTNFFDATQADPLLDYPEDDDDVVEEPHQETPVQVAEDPNDLRALRKKAKRFDEVEAQRKAAERRLAILKAGIDLDSPHGELFDKVYDGESTVEAVTAEANRYGLKLRPR